MIREIRTMDVHLKKTSKILRKRAKRIEPGWGRKVLRWGLGLILGGLVMAAAAVGIAYWYVGRDLPKISSLLDYRPSIITSIYSDDDRKIGEFYKERRIVIPLSEMPETLILAFIAAEDSRFFMHQGIDIFSIVRAFFKNIEAGAIVQGGSTITQQLTKSFFLTPEKSYRRKLKEAILAYRIDRRFSKEEILFLYLNQIYLGHGAYGVEAAAENYFGKSAKELNLSECSMLAGLPQAPSRYSPFQYPERAKERQIYVLNRMISEGYISNIQATEAINTPIDIKSRRNWYIEQVPFYTEYVRQYIENQYGDHALYHQGLKIYTAVNIEMQTMARNALLKGLSDLDKRQGYRGPRKRLKADEIESFFQKPRETEEPLQEGRIVQGVVIGIDSQDKSASIRLHGDRGKLGMDSMRWAHAGPEARVDRVDGVLHVGDVILVRLQKKDHKSNLWDLQLEQQPRVQGALLCLAAETGEVKAMVGGRDFKESQYNRAIQSRRQPGSAFKPVIYAAALDKGYTPATVLIDSPIVYENADPNIIWKPQNYEGKFKGRILFRDALAQSRNVVTIKLLQDIGIDYAIEYARNLGITSPLSRDLTIALGSSGVSLLELVKSYSVFNNQGYLIEPVFIKRIEDRDGNVIEAAAVVPRKVIEKSTAYVMTSLLESVVQDGTGRRVRALNRPVAGKTGTTNNLFDAWFVGYTPRYVAGTWVGFDEEKPLGNGETGSRAASPIWLEFMQQVLEGKPVRVFQVPEGVVFTKIDADTGLLPIPTSRNTLFECFKEGTVPTRYSSNPTAVTDSEQFYKSDL